MAVYGNRFQTSISISMEENNMFEEIMTSISEMTEIEVVSEAAIGDKIRVIINKIKHLLSELVVKIKTKISEIKGKPFRDFWAWFKTESTINKVILNGQKSFDEVLYTEENAERVKSYVEKNTSSAEYLSKDNGPLKDYFNFTDMASTCKSHLMSLLSSQDITKDQAEKTAKEIQYIIYNKNNNYSTDDLVSMFKNKQIINLHAEMVAILSGNYLKNAYILFDRTNSSISAEKYIKYLSNDGSKSNIQEFEFVFDKLIRVIRNIAYRTIYQYKFCVGFTMLLMSLSGYNRKK